MHAYIHICMRRGVLFLRSKRSICNSLYFSLRTASTEKPGRVEEGKGGWRGERDGRDLRCKSMAIHIHPSAHPRTHLHPSLILGKPLFSSSRSHWWGLRRNAKRNCMYRSMLYTHTSYATSRAFHNVSVSQSVSLSLSLSPKERKNYQSRNILFLYIYNSIWGLLGFLYI